MTLTLAHRDFLLREQMILPALVNFIINAVVAWCIFSPAPSVPVWGASGLWADTLITLFVLPLITCAIVTPLTRKGVLLGHVPSVPWRSTELSVLRWMPERTLWRGVVLGLATVLSIGSLATLGFVLLGADALTLTRSVLLKGAVGALSGAAVTPVMALYALGVAPLQARWTIP